MASRFINLSSHDSMHKESVEVTEQLQLEPVPPPSQQFSKMAALASVASIAALTLVNASRSSAACNASQRPGVRQLRCPQAQCELECRKHIILWRSSYFHELLNSKGDQTKSIECQNRLMCEFRLAMFADGSQKFLLFLLESRNDDLYAVHDRD